MRKKILCFILTVLAALCPISLLSCSGDNKYPAVESTDEEKKTVFTLSLGDEKYDVKYELYRFLLLSRRSQVDGGDTSVWDGSGSAEYREKLNNLIISDAARIYSAISLGKKHLDDAKVEATVDKCIAASIEGGDIPGYGSFIGFGGSYDDYLSDLKKRNLNYSVQRLLIKETVILSMLDTCFRGDETTGVEPKLTPTDEELRTFYESDDCVRVYRAYISAHSGAAEQAENIRRLMLDAAGDDERVSLVVIQNSLTEAEDARYGEVVGRHSANSDYPEITEAIFSLGYGEVSPVIEAEGYYVFYRSDKPDSFPDTQKEKLLDCYINNYVGNLIDEGAATLRSSVTGDALGQYDPMKVEMS